MGKALLRDGDVISGAVLSALGLFIFLQAQAWNYSGPDGPGPAFFPTWYGLGMIALSLALIVQAVRKRACEKTSGNKAAIDWTAVTRGFGTWAAFTLSVALYRPLGFTVSFALLTCFIVAVIFRRPPLVAVATGIGLAAAFYLTFVVALDVALPAGWLGF